MIEPRDTHRRLRLRAGVILAPADGGRWQARWDFDEITFLVGDSCARVLPWLIPLLDGTRSADEILSLPTARGLSSEAAEVLRLLREEGLLVDVIMKSSSDPLDSPIEALRLDPTETQSRLSRARIAIAGASPLANAACAALRAQGLAAGIMAPSEPLPPSPFHEEGGQGGEADGWVPTFFSPSPSDGEGVGGEDSSTASAPSFQIPNFSSQSHRNCFPLVIEQDCSPSFLSHFNAHALSHRRPWMILGAWNSRILVGPIFIPGDTACWRCLRARLDSHRRHAPAFRVLEERRRALQSPTNPEPALPAIQHLAASLAALELFHYFAADRAPRIIGRVIVQYPQEARMETETVLRLPWCPDCSGRDSPGARA